MKYQLVVYWKDGSASGREIDVDWPLQQNVKNIKEVKLISYGMSAPLKPRKPKKFVNTCPCVNGGSCSCR